MKMVSSPIGEIVSSNVRKPKKRAASLEQKKLVTSSTVLHPFAAELFLMTFDRMK
jgi:hypothetical protein